MIGVAGEDALAVSYALGESSREKVNDGPLVVRLGKFGCDLDQPIDQTLRLLKLPLADREPHLAEHAILFGIAGAKPDGPERVFSHGAHGHVGVADALPNTALLCSKLPKSPSASTAARRAAVSEVFDAIRPRVASLYRTATRF